MRREFKRVRIDELAYSIASIFELDVVFKDGNVVELDGRRVKRSEFRDKLSEFRRPIFIESKQLRNLPHGFVTDARKRYKTLKCNFGTGAINTPKHVKAKSVNEVLEKWGFYFEGL